MADLNKLWVEKYRPQVIEEYIFQDDKQKASFLKMIDERSIPHLLLSGVQGSGKTTLAKILINEMQLDENDVLTINASDQNNVEVIRDTIKTFISTFAMSGYKIVHLEEADYLTLNAQGIMRGLMEDYADVARFILSCNYENKIMPAIRSRCQCFRFKSSNRDDIAEYMVKILASEHIQFDLDLIDKYISIHFPDIRSIIQSLQKNSVDGILQAHNDEGAVGDYKFELLNLIERDQWFEARKLACASVVAEEWEYIFRFLYENLHKTPKFSAGKYEDGIVIVADHLYKHALVADPEINAAAMFIRLTNI